MEIIDIIVEFERWCPSCKHLGKHENEDPCSECVENSVNQESEKPVKYEPAQKS